MKRNILYILGLFENQENPLFEYLKKDIESSGITCHAIELYTKDRFGSHSFFKDIEDLQEIIDALKPEMVIAHSLGAYISMYLSVNCPTFFLDPSLAIADIIFANLKKENGLYWYNDGNHAINLSPEFIESVKTTLSIEESAQHILSQHVHIFGAGKGGHKIAEHYHKHIPQSQYIFLPDADHQFSNENDRQQILVIIKKRLDIMSSREEGVHTKSW